jgi:hypothetical protein
MLHFIIVVILALNATILVLKEAKAVKTVDNLKNLLPKLLIFVKMGELLKFLQERLEW